MTRKIIPCILLGANGASPVGEIISDTYPYAGKGIYDTSGLKWSEPKKLALDYESKGAGELLIFLMFDDDEGHEAVLVELQGLIDAIHIPVWAGGGIKRLEDVKKILYAGAAGAVIDASSEEELSVIKEASERFGKDKLAVFIPPFAECAGDLGDIATSACRLIGTEDVLGRDAGRSGLGSILFAFELRRDELADTLAAEHMRGVTGPCVSDPSIDIEELKEELRTHSIDMNALVTVMSFDELAVNSKGLIPCIVQDDDNDEVLMMAWMNRESFEATLRTGKMTYYSRSRQKLWLKGETSGHLQYVRSLKADCDRDTLLARVIQVGAACHTGNRSCFFTSVTYDEAPRKRTGKVLDEVMAIIRDRHINPKEGSYTNYLFDKGLDKILKKVGEENAEIIIAAKNPGAYELKYEIADYLYHLMVLMEELGLTWDDIAEELSRR